MREVIDFETRVAVRDAERAVKYEWQTLYQKVPAEVEADAPPGATEAFFSLEQREPKNYRVTIRYSTEYENTITATHRIKWRGIALDIVTGPYNRNGENERLVMVCRSGVTQG